MVGLEQGPGIVYHWKGTLFHLSHLLLETRASQVSYLSNTSLSETDVVDCYVKRAMIIKSMILEAMQGALM